MELGPVIVKYRVVVKQPGQPAEIVMVDWADNLSYLQSVVGGYIELVYLSPELDMYINEEGKLLELEPNLSFPGDTIVGPVVVCSHDDEGDTIGLTVAQAELIREVLNNHHIAKRG